MIEFSSKIKLILFKKLFKKSLVIVNFKWKMRISNIKEQKISKHIFIKRSVSAVFLPLKLKINSILVL